MDRHERRPECNRREAGMLTHKSKRGTRSQAEDLVLATITQHADALLRTARRHSLCADDASDAYQRALEIFLRNAARLDPARAASWLHTVVRVKPRLGATSA